MTISAQHPQTTPGPESMTADFGFAMIMPDGLDFGLDGPIIERIEQSGLSIVARSLCVLSGEQIDALYPKQHDEPWYPDMKAARLGERVMSLIVAGTDVVDKLQELKGTAADVDGSIRGEFSGGHLLPTGLRERYSTSNLTDADRNSPEWRAVRRDDRIHTDETARGAVNSISTMFRPDQIDEATFRFPRLKEFIRVNRNSKTDA